MITEKQTSKPQFTWHKVDCEFRIKKTSHYVKIPLKPALNFTLPDQPNNPIKTRLHIDIEKSLQFQNSIGWNWHKSSNIPVFSIKLSIFKQFPGAFINPPPQLQANIYAVKIVQNTFQKEEHLYLEDIGIKGENQIKLNDGCGYFNSLKFSSTSYNNEGVKFHLLIVVFKNEDKNDLLTNIICSVISPPIFVDSRKSARNYQEKKYLSFVELFNPNELQKLFAKRQSKDMVEEKKVILNNDEGLFNYLTAPNIRHKVKHPLFLAVRFSSAFKIFFNPKSKYFSEKQTTLNCIVTRLQKKIIKEVGMLKRAKNSQSSDEKQFAIALNFQSMTERQKIFDMLEYLDCQSICLLEKSQISENFIDIFQVGDIIEVYKNEYHSLRRKSDRQISQMKTKRVKNEDEENQNPMEENAQQQTLFDKIIHKEEDKFSASNPIPNDEQRESLPLEKVENRAESLRALGFSFKKLKPNESDLSRNEQYIRFPLNEQMQQKFAQERMNLENYQNNSLNFYSMYGSGNQLVKSENQYIIQYVSREEVEYKIKQMCVQVYQRNKKSILHYLEALKKSNIKWKVKDVQQFIFSYSSALMDAIHYRERLLHHMFLENQILKAKVGVMQQMALADLNKIKGNIFSMNKFLPEKFIIEKLKRNSLWSQQFNDKNDKNEEKLVFNPKVAEVKAIESGQAQPVELKVESNCSSSKQSERMIEEASSSDRDSLGCECNFVSNVFELPSESIKQ